MEFYGIEKLSLVDFDQKISCTLFTSACNFRCPFCHNSSLVISNDAPSISKDAIYKYLKSWQSVSIDSPIISGYIADKPSVNRTMKNYNKVITVTY